MEEEKVYMIRGSWEMLRLFCGNHGQLVELKMVSTPQGIFYKCEEERCDTILSLKEYEEILQYLSDMIVQSELEGEVLNLAYTAWKTKSGVKCRVLLHQEDCLHVMVDCCKRKKAVANRIPI